MQYKLEPRPQQIVRAAVAAAGGASKVAEEFGIASASVSGWMERGSVPGARIRRLVELGGGIVTVDQLLALQERAAA